MLLVVLASAACGGGRARVQVPPRLDLVPYQRVGLVVFTVENAEGSLHTFATQRFGEAVLGAQRIELLELGEQRDLLGQDTPGRYGPAAARAVGEAHDVSAVFFGHLVVSNIKPKASLSDLARMRAEVDVSLSVRLLSTASGSTVWSRSSRATATVAELTLSGGLPRFGARDPEDAYGELVGRLVREVTRDLRPTYARR
jgi:hypothetical protein